MTRSRPSGAIAPTSTMRNNSLLATGLVFVVMVLFALIILPPLVGNQTNHVQTRLDNDVQLLANTLYATENELQQMQAAVRGYLFSQSPQYLEQYRAARMRLATNLQHTAQLASRVDPELGPQIDDLTAIIERWQIEGSDSQAALIQQGRTVEAVETVAGGANQALFDASLSRINDLQAQNQEIRDQLKEQLAQIQALDSAITTGLSVLGLVAAAFVIVGFHRLSILTRGIETASVESTKLAQQVHDQLADSRSRNRQLTVLHNVAMASAMNIQLEQRAQSVLEAITSTLDLPFGIIWSYDPKHDRFSPIAWRLQGTLSHLDAPSTWVSDEDWLVVNSAAPPSAIDVLHHNRLLVISDAIAESPPDMDNLHNKLGFTVRSSLLLPLRGRSQPIAVLMLASAKKGFLDNADMAFFETLALQVGLVLENALLSTGAQVQYQWLQAVFDHSPDGIVVVEATEGAIVLVNYAAMELITDLVPDAVLADHPMLQRLYQPGGASCPPEQFPLLQTLRDGDARRGVDLVLEQTDGPRVPIRVTSVPMYHEDGRLQGAVAVIQDLRHIREVERMKSNFVAMVSHELRTPLTIIRGCTETLMAGNASPARTREFLRIIDDKGEQLQELIDNLLNMSQVEAGALPLRCEPVALPLLVRNVVRQMRDRLAGLRIQTDLSQRLPLVNVDSRRIEQVFFNLLDNARKFSPAGSVITITAAADADEVHVTVRDQGPGIPPSERTRVFERFYQAPQPGIANTSGTGLGLAICKALVEAHQGRISINPAAGGGANVEITLPALVDQEPLPLTHPSLIVRNSGPQPRVLVVDDDSALRRLLESNLSDAGYAVQTAIEGQSAITAVANQQPDIVLLDLMLPGPDGIAICRQLREWSSVPIIMLTARSSMHDIELGFQAGADDYLTKPFHLSELHARIQAVMRRSQMAVTADGLAIFHNDDLMVDLAKRRVFVNDAPVGLTPIEYNILSFLVRHAGQILTHEQILREVWGDEYHNEHHYVWVHIAHLRQKIEPDPKRPRYILTERGVGYRLAKT